MENPKLTVTMRGTQIPGGTDQHQVLAGLNLFADPRQKVGCYRRIRVRAVHRQGYGIYATILPQVEMIRVLCHGDHRTGAIDRDHVVVDVARVVRIGPAGLRILCP